jgi:hypothetical protein
LEGEDWIQLVLTGCKSLGHCIANTKMALSITPNHFGYMDIRRLIASLQKAFPLARTVDFQANDLVKLPREVIYPKYDQTTPLLPNIVWNVRSMAFHQRTAFVTQFAKYLSFIGQAQVDVLFPSMTRWYVYLKTDTRDERPLVESYDMFLRVMPSSCVDITINGRTREPFMDELIAFDDRITSRNNYKKQLVALKIPHTGLVRKDLSLPQFASLESLEMLMMPGLDTSVLPKTLTSLKLTYPEHGENDEVLSVSADLPMLKRLMVCGCVALFIPLPKSLTAFEAVNLIDDDHLMHASTIPSGLETLKFYGRVLCNNRTQTCTLVHHLFRNVAMDDVSWHDHWPERLQIHCNEMDASSDVVFQRFTYRSTPQTLYTVTMMALAHGQVEAVADPKLLRLYFAHSKGAVNWTPSMLKFLRCVDEKEAYAMENYDVQMLQTPILTLEDPSDDDDDEENDTVYRHPRLVGDSGDTIDSLLGKMSIIFPNICKLNCTYEFIKTLNVMPKWVSELEVSDSGIHLVLGAFTLPTGAEKVKCLRMGFQRSTPSGFGNVLLNLPCRLLSLLLQLNTSAVRALLETMEVFASSLPRTLEVLHIETGSRIALPFFFDDLATDASNHLPYFEETKRIVATAPLLPPRMKHIRLLDIWFEQSTVDQFIEACQLVPHLHRLVFTCIIGRLATEPSTIHCHSYNKEPIN